MRLLTEITHYQKRKNLRFLYFIPGFLFLMLYLFRFNQQLFITVSLIGYVAFFFLYRPELNNIMFLTLTGFLAAPAIWAFVCVVILDGYVSVWFEEYQTVENTVRMQVLTLIALFAHGFAWNLGLSGANKSYGGQIVSRTYDNKLSHLNPVYLFMFFILAAIFSGWQAGISGVPIWEGAYGYASSGRGRLLSLGVYPVWAVANLIAAYVILKKCFPGHKTRRIIWFLTVFFVIGYEFLSKGSRLEVVAFVIALFAVKYVLENEPPQLSRVFLFSVITLFLVNFVGSIRSSVHLGGIQFDAVKNALRVTRLNETGTHTNSISTFGPVSATFYRALADIDDNVYDYMYGSSYIDFIPRTLPEFIYPDRPQAIVWNHSAQGGIFVLAEAYLNFGAFGCFLIPFVISFLMSRYVCGKVVFLQNPSWWELGWYGFLTAALVRGLWYQTFTLYKSWIVTLILWQMICLTVSIYRKHLIRPIMQKRYSRDDLQTRATMNC